MRHFFLDPVWLWTADIVHTFGAEGPDTIQVVLAGELCGEGSDQSDAVESVASGGVSWITVGGAQGRVAAE